MLQQQKQQQEQDTSVTARWRLRAINEWHRLAQAVDARKFLRNDLARKTYESNMHVEILVLEQSGYRVFFCEQEGEYQLRREGEEQSA